MRLYLHALYTPSYRLAGALSHSVHSAASIFILPLRVPHFTSGFTTLCSGRAVSLYLTTLLRTTKEYKARTTRSRPPVSNGVLSVFSICNDVTIPRRVVEGRTKYV
jgi:hypothetical protein